jgi:signal transduction histidine kinase
MASETPTRTRAHALARRATRVRRAQAVAAAMVLALAAADAVRAQESPRELVLCAIAALCALGLAAMALRQLAVAPPATEDGGGFGPSPRQGAAHLALLESQLDQAPVALWWLTQGQVAPLNNAARRLVAPGGAANADDLLAQLKDSAAAPQRQVLTLASERGPERFLLASRTLLVDGAESRLLVQMPIESELEAETLKAWRQLVHVLTHEIMNSLTPIASLSRTAHELLDERRARGASDAARRQAPDAAVDDDLAVALEAIARRAEALASFVADYRRVSDWPEPQLAAVELAPLFARLERLVAADWRLRGGAARFDVQPATLTLMADAGQLEQALLNLLHNAAQATAATSDPQVSVTARLVRGGRLAIAVRDNGPGVPHGIEQDIFMPFFTTREHGTGIGLAVVRNLVQGMGGSLRHVKPASGGASFVLSF